MKTDCGCTYVKQWLTQNQRTSCLPTHRLSNVNTTKAVPHMQSSRKRSRHQTHIHRESTQTSFSCTCLHKILTDLKKPVSLACSKINGSHLSHGHCGWASRMKQITCSSAWGRQPVLVQVIHTKKFIKWCTVCIWGNKDITPRCLPCARTTFSHLQIVKVKLRPNKALDKNSSLSYGTLPTIWDHTVPPNTSERAHLNPSQ